MADWLAEIDQFPFLIPLDDSEDVLGRDIVSTRSRHQSSGRKRQFCIETRTREKVSSPEKPEFPSLPPRIDPED